MKSIFNDDPASKDSIIDESEVTLNKMDDIFEKFRIQIRDLEHQLNSERQVTDSLNTKCTSLEMSGQELREEIRSLKEGRQTLRNEILKQNVKIQDTEADLESANRKLNSSEEKISDDDLRAVAVRTWLYSNGPYTYVDLWKVMRAIDLELFGPDQSDGATKKAANRVNHAHKKRYNKGIQDP